MSLDELKNLDAKRASLEELVEISAQARIVQAEFIILGVEAPEWIGLSVASLLREITLRTADAREAKLRNLKSQRAALATTQEKRDLLDKEIAALEGKASAA